MLVDRRTWIDRIYECGYTPNMETAFIQTADDEYHNDVLDHERVIPMCEKHLERLEQEEKVRTGPVDARLFKLPPLAIKEYAGDPEKFLAFQQNFEAVVGKQPLKKHQKLAHLRGFLRGKAYDALVSVGTEDADYDTAWAILEKRFGDKSELVSQLLGAMAKMDDFFDKGNLIL